MKANLKTVGIIALSAAILYYPAMKLYQYLAKKARENGDDKNAGEDGHVMKAFTPAYRGTHKVHPHHRN